MPTHPSLESCTTGIPAAAEVGLQRVRQWISLMFLEDSGTPLHGKEAPRPFFPPLSLSPSIATLQRSLAKKPTTLLFLQALLPSLLGEERAGASFLAAPLEKPQGAGQGLLTHQGSQSSKGAFPSPQEISHTEAPAGGNRGPSSGFEGGCYFCRALGCFVAA